MKKFLFAAGCLSLLAFASCKKDDKENNEGGDPSVTKLIKKMTEVENGVTTTYIFNYDGAKRLSNFVSTDGSQGATFTYDTRGNISKVVSVEADFKNVYMYTWQNDLPVSAHLQTWTMEDGDPQDLIEDDILTYTITDNKVSKIHLEMQDDEELDFNLTYSNNGNLTRVQSSVAGIYTADFAFGNKKSPFPQITKYVLDQAGFSLVYGSKNELITASFDFFGTGLDKTTTRVYTYDASGYPLTANDGSLKVTYEYQ